MQKEDKKDDGKTPEIILILVQQLNYVATEKEIELQKEEDGSKIANLQGFLAGVRSYKNTMKASSYTLDAEIDSTEARMRPYFINDDCLIEFSELREIVSIVDKITSSNDYKAFKDLWGNAVEEEKNRLFYLSKKGRDLHFAKGWYKAMTWVDCNIDKLYEELVKMEKEAKLPF